MAFSGTELDMLNKWNGLEALGDISALLLSTFHHLLSAFYLSTGYLTWQSPHESGPGSFQYLALVLTKLLLSPRCPGFGPAKDTHIHLPPIHPEIFCLDHLERWTLAMVKSEAENNEQLIPQPHT